MDIQAQLLADIQQALDSLHIQLEATLHIEPCAAAAFGDYTSNVAMQIFPTVDKSRWSAPQALAQSIVDEMSKLLSSNSYLSTLAVAGPGFINFTVANSVFTELMANISQKNFDIKPHGEGKTAIVEYSSPNIAKPFTIGHLRSTIIGDAVANLLESIEYKVLRDNHVGDWGTQFGKLIVAIKKWGDLEQIETAVDPVKDLVALYVRFHEEAENDSTLEDEARVWFSRLEKDDPEARFLWKKCIGWSWKEFDRIYTELGVTFSENEGKGYSESFFEDKMTPVVSELEKSGYLQEGKEGARLFFFPNETLPPLMILKKDGSTLYATRDLATDKYRLDHYKPNLIINEVGAEQELYFKQIYAIEEILGWYKIGTRFHVKHGHFRFKDSKMSTRKGNVIWLQDVIDEAKKRAPDPLIAIGALKWNDLKRSAHLDITFDWDEILSMEGNSGPYLQYTAVRCKSVLEKANISYQLTANSCQLNSEERAVARQLQNFTTTLERAALEFSPHYLCTYLYELAQNYNSFYGKHQILTTPEESKNLRLTLTVATLEVLTKGLAILGIQVPDKM